MRMRLSLFALGGLLLLSVGCSSTQELEADRLPFRVALMPIEAPRVIEAGGAELEGEPTETQLHLDPVEVVDRLQSALSQYCFVDVQILDPGEDDGNASDRQARMIRHAADINADLLVELDLRYQKTIWHQTNGSWWLNIPVFLLAGPGMYFLHDISYAADVELTATFYDSPSIVSSDTELGDQVSRYLSSQNSFTGSDLSFPDRIDSNYEYLYSLLIPTGFLAQDTETIGERLAQDVIDDLSRQLVTSVQSRRQDLLRAEHICPIRLDPSEVALARAPDGTTEVTGQVHMASDRARDRLHMVRLRADDQVAMAEIGEPKKNGNGEMVYPFRGTLNPNSSHVRVEFEVGARDRLLRSFTFALSE